jgi:hypothetical protein
VSAADLRRWRPLRIAPRCGSYGRAIVLAVCGWGLGIAAFGLASSLWAALAGLVASLTGSVRIAIVSGGLACMVVAVAVTLVRPALWRYDALVLPVPDPRQP